MPSDRPRAGFYPHKDYPGALRYWDGERWTDQLTPMPQPAAASGTSVGTVAVGVIIAAVVIAVGGWFIHGVVTANDEVDCSIENVERSLDGLSEKEC